MAIEIELNLESTLTRTIPGQTSLKIDEVTRENFVFGSVEFFVYSKITPTQILVPIQDPPPSGAETGIGNLGNEMVDNNIGSISYNNFGAATPVNLPFYTFDFGVGKSVDRFKIYWYQFNNYVANLFRIEASNNNSDWVTIEDNLVGTNIVGNIQDVDISDNTEYQYWRMFCYSGFGNPNFIVIREMEALTAGTVFESIESSNDVSFYFDDEGKLNVENLNSINTELTVRYNEINN